MTRGPASSCVYIGREGLVFKAVAARYREPCSCCIEGDTNRTVNDIDVNRNELLYICAGW